MTSAWITTTPCWSWRRPTSGGTWSWASAPRPSSSPGSVCSSPASITTGRVSWCTASARPRTKPTTSCTSAATLSQGPAAPGSTPACGTADAGAGSARSSGSSPDTSGWTTAGRLRSSTWRCASRRSNSPRSATGSKETTWTAEKAEHLLSLR